MSSDSRIYSLKLKVFFLKKMKIKDETVSQWSFVKIQKLIFEDVVYFFWLLLFLLYEADDRGVVIYLALIFIYVLYTIVSQNF